MPVSSAVAVQLDVALAEWQEGNLDLLVGNNHHFFQRSPGLPHRPSELAVCHGRRCRYGQVSQFFRCLNRPDPTLLDLRLPQRRGQRGDWRRLHPGEWLVGGGGALGVCGAFCWE